MTESPRYGATVDDGWLYLEGDDERLEIGSMETVIELFGGETYTIEYEPQQSGAAWLATDEDDTITFDVRETLVDWAYTEEFVANVEACSLEETDGDGYPLRASVFVDVVTSIWDAKGNLDT
ncbi:hypothetical protein [Natrarchaeobius chitinivorans]|uniref:Uncharacterized protein n=1 Tax=Natrarchaeobius chitinivorans TaxID=1679083 RepID=A0A3N6MP73_NATCH|nr:hypothetical protein [Natrarchaeobius chitinivorans]RQG97951.1 hypothetical protein EA473_01805 [Natrarchaeobius chitinivorans]